jgi:ketosteroid isomerase-like protein
MDQIEVVKAYFAALDSTDIEQANRYLSEDYRLVDFVQQPMDSKSRLEMVGLFKAALPNLMHSLSNIRVEQNVVKVTVQLSGTNSGALDLRKMGLGVVPRSRRFIIFPTANYELTVRDGKITTERDVSPVSSNRRLPGMLKAFL